MARKKTPSETDAERRLIARLNAEHRGFMKAVGSGRIDGDIVRPGPRRIDRRTAREIADGVPPYYD